MCDSSVDDELRNITIKNLEISMQICRYIRWQNLMQGKGKTNIEGRWRSNQKVRSNYHACSNYHVC